MVSDHYFVCCLLLLFVCGFIPVFDYFIFTIFALVRMFMA